MCTPRISNACARVLSCFGIDSESVKGVCTPKYRIFYDLVCMLRTIIITTRTYRIAKWQYLYGTEGDGVCNTKKISGGVLTQIHPVAIPLPYILRVAHFFFIGMSLSYVAIPQICMAKTLENFSSNYHPERATSLCLTCLELRRVNLFSMPSGCAEKEHQNCDSDWKLIAAMGNEGIGAKWVKPQERSLSIKGYDNVTQPRCTPCVLASCSKFAGLVESHNDLLDSTANDRDEGRHRLTSLVGQPNTSETSCTVAFTTRIN